MADRAFIAHPHEVRALLDGRQTRVTRMAREFELVPGTKPIPRGVVKPRAKGAPSLYPAPFAVGDRLWVRETIATWMSSPTIPYIGGTIGGGDVVYRATETKDWADLLHDRAQLARLNADRHERSGNWVVRTAANCPRWASRLTLTVTDLACRRVQEISEEEARAEGIPWDSTLPLPAFRDLWNSLHGPDAWTRNDWVFSASVRVSLSNIDALAA